MTKHPGIARTVSSGWYRLLRERGESALTDAVWSRRATPDQGAPDEGGDRWAGGARVDDPLNRETSLLLLDARQTALMWSQCNQGVRDGWWTDATIQNVVGTRRGSVSSFGGAALAHSRLGSGIIPVLISVGSSANPSTLGQDVTYTVTLTTTNEGALDPTDGIEFQDNGNAIRIATTNC